MTKEVDHCSDTPEQQAKFGPNGNKEIIYYYNEPNTTIRSYMKTSDGFGYEFVCPDPVIGGRKLKHRSKRSKSKYSKSKYSKSKYTKSKRPNKRRRQTRKKRHNKRK